MSNSKQKTKSPMDEFAEVMAQHMPDSMKQYMMKIMLTDFEEYLQDALSDSNIIDGMLDKVIASEGFYQDPVLLKKIEEKVIEAVDDLIKNNDESIEVSIKNMFQRQVDEILNKGHYKDSIKRYAEEAVAKRLK